MFAITAGTIHHHSFIGGQHGEEEKGKGSGNEGREEGQAPEEEVGETLLTVSTSDEVELPDMGRRESRSGASPSSTTLTVSPKLAGASSISIWVLRPTLMSRFVRSSGTKPWGSALSV